jgi:predicted nucleic acid-binding protein
MPLVIDASVTMAWCFEDESSELADRVLESFGTDRAVVPSLWTLEIANVLLVAERRGRITHAQSEHFLALLKLLPIDLDLDVDHAEVMAAGRLHGLSAYDAAYLVVALRHGLAIASLDAALCAAAESSGVQRWTGLPARKKTLVVRDRAQDRTRPE